jgi:hypothetical protein
MNRPSACPCSERHVSETELVKRYLPDSVIISPLNSIFFLRNSVEELKGCTVTVS